MPSPVAALGSAALADGAHPGWVCRTSYMRLYKSPHRQESAWHASQGPAVPPSAGFLPRVFGSHPGLWRPGPSCSRNGSLGCAIRAATGFSSRQHATCNCSRGGGSNDQRGLQGRQLQHCRGPCSGGRSRHCALRENSRIPAAAAAAFASPPPQQNSYSPAGCSGPGMPNALPT